MHKYACTYQVYIKYYILIMFIRSRHNSFLSLGEITRNEINKYFGNKYFFVKMRIET